MPEGAARLAPAYAGGGPRGGRVLRPGGSARARLRAHVGLGDACAVNAFYDYLSPRDAYPRAEAAARRAIELDHTLAAPQSAAARDSARAIVGEIAARRTRGEYMPAYEIAKVHLALGGRRAALEWLTRAVEDRSHSRAFFRVDPQLAPLRQDPQFEGLVARASMER